MSNQNSAVLNVFMTGVFRAKKALATLTGKDLCFINVVCRILAHLPSGKIFSSGLKRAIAW